MLSPLNTLPTSFPACTQPASIVIQNNFAFSKSVLFYGMLILRDVKNITRKKIYEQVTCGNTMYYFPLLAIHITEKFWWGGQEVRRQNFANPRLPNLFWHGPLFSHDVLLISHKALFPTTHFGIHWNGKGEFLCDVLCLLLWGNYSQVWDPHWQWDWLGRKGNSKLLKERHTTPGLSKKKKKESFRWKIGYSKVRQS